jgi:hypothetical protein
LTGRAVPIWLLNLQQKRKLVFFLQHPAQSEVELCRKQLTRSDGLQPLRHVFIAFAPPERAFSRAPFMKTAKKETPASSTLNKHRRSFKILHLPRLQFAGVAKACLTPKVSTA